MPKCFSVSGPKCLVAILTEINSALYSNIYLYSLNSLVHLNALFVYSAYTLIRTVILGGEDFANKNYLQKIMGKICISTKNILSSRKVANECKQHDLRTILTSFITSKRTYFQLVSVFFKCPIFSFHIYILPTA